MPRKPDPRDRNDQTPFASWLDSMIPAVFSTDAEFARQLGVEQSSVLRWRRGSVPQVPVLVKMSDATGTAIATLMRIAGYETGSGGDR